MLSIHDPIELILGCFLFLNWIVSKKIIIGRTFLLLIFISIFKNNKKIIIKTYRLRSTVAPLI